MVNLAPADLPKEGSHYDVPIALAMMAAIGAMPKDALDNVVAFGELGLDGSLAPTPGRIARSDGRAFRTAAPSSAPPRAARKRRGAEEKWLRRRR
ncbi:MAG: magnesium chelatase domain-containing protein [Terricaulis sp.]